MMLAPKYRMNAYMLIRGVPFFVTTGNCVTFINFVWVSAKAFFALVLKSKNMPSLDRLKTFSLVGEMHSPF